MTEPLKFFKVDDSTIYHDGFTYSFYRILDPAKLSADLRLQQSFHCQEENCRSRCHVTGNYEMDKKGRKFMLGIVKKADHTHGMEYRDTTPKLRFYKNDDDGSVHRNGFGYTFNRELDPPKQIGNFQWHRTYCCALSDQENCRGRIYTTGKWVLNKRELHYQLGIFKNCNHNHGSDQDSNKEDKENQDENNIVASASSSNHTTDLDKKKQIRFYKFKETCVQHNGFVYSDPQEMKSHSKWRCRMRCQRKINGKRTCTGLIWTTGKWDEDERGRKYQTGIIMNGHDHEPYQIAFQGKDNDDESPEAGLKFYKYIENKVHRDGHVYSLESKLKSHRPPWKQRMRCKRTSEIDKKLRCTGCIWTTGEWETDGLGRLYQRGILRGGHSHKAYEQFLNEDDAAFVGNGGPMHDEQSLDENDVVMIED